MAASSPYSTSSPSARYSLGSSGPGDSRTFTRPARRSVAGSGFSLPGEAEPGVVGPRKTSYHRLNFDTRAAVAAAGEAEDDQFLVSSSLEQLEISEVGPELLLQGDGEKLNSTFNKSGEEPEPVPASKTSCDLNSTFDKSLTRGGQNSTFTRKRTSQAGCSRINGRQFSKQISGDSLAGPGDPS